MSIAYRELFLLNMEGIHNMEQPSAITIIDKLGDENFEGPTPYDITSYGSDMPVDGIVKRLNNNSIFIPSFQRSFVWTLKQATRFVESLLLGLPVPGIFLSKESSTQKYLVIDGQQRLRTLQFFYNGIFEPNSKEFVLKGVQKQFENCSYRTLSEQDQLRLDNSILHATIVQQEHPANDDSSIYYIFERLNTGGTPLQPQEIRSSVYHGALNDMTKLLNENQAWRLVLGIPSRRLKDQELILRFFALYFGYNTYTKPMREFLNRYMMVNRDVTPIEEKSLSSIFESTIEFLQECIGTVLFKPTRGLNAAVYDSIMVATAQRLSFGKIIDKHAFHHAYDSLLQGDLFMKLTSTSTADEANVKQRISMAIKAFEVIE